MTKVSPSHDALVLRACEYDLANARVVFRWATFDEVIRRCKEQRMSHRVKHAAIAVDKTKAQTASLIHAKALAPILFAAWLEPRDLSERLIAWMIDGDYQFRCASQHDTIAVAGHAKLPAKSGIVDDEATRTRDSDWLESKRKAILAHLKPGKWETLADLREVLVCSSSTMTRVVTPLVERGDVIRAKIYGGAAVALPGTDTPPPIATDVDLLVARKAAADLATWAAREVIAKLAAPVIRQELTRMIMDHGGPAVTAHYAKNAIDAEIVAGRVTVARSRWSVLIGPKPGE